MNSSQLKKTILALLILISLNNSGFAQVNDFDFLQKIPLRTHFNESDFNGGIQNWCFEQNEDGILYVGNNNCLLEFDGQEWERHEIPFSNRLTSVLISTDKKIYVGGSGLIGFFTPVAGKLEFTSLNSLIPDNKPSISEVWNIIEHKQKIYFNTESEIYKYENETLEPMKLPGYMRYIYKSDNRLFAQFWGMDLFELIDDNFVSIPNTNIGQDIVSIIPVGNKFHCFTREGNIYELNPQGCTKINTTTDLGTLNKVIKLSSGDIACATQNDGVFIFNSNYSIKYHLTKNKGLSNRTAKNIFEDHFQNLWVALNNGIDYVKLSLPFYVLDDNVGIDGTGYAGTIHGDRVYLGTNNGVFSTKFTNATSVNASFNLFPNTEGQVYSFSKINNELFLNHNRGAFEIRNQQLVPLNNIGNWTLVETANPNYIVGGGYRGITAYHKQNGRWREVPNRPGLDESLRLIEFQNDSTLWATNPLKGVFQINFDKNFNSKSEAVLFSTANGLPHNKNNDIYSIDDKVILSTSDGLYDFNESTTRFEKNEYLNSFLDGPPINSVSTNSNKSIFFIQNLELGEIKHKGLGDYEKSNTIFKHINNLLNDDLPNITTLNDSNILIGAKEGFIIYNPKKKRPINSEFKVLIKNIATWNENDLENIHYFNKNNTIEIAKNQSIKVNVASTYFDGFEALKFSYRLSPLQSTWSSWSSLNSKEFGHLPSGDYTLEIKAINIYEEESEITTINFTILTPWYWSNWAKFSYVLLFLFLITLIPLYQRIHFKKERTVLQEGKVKALKIKDQEINKLENEKLKTEIDLKNDQLTTITMQLVRNNEFIQNIQKDLLSSIENNSSKRDLKKISRNIDAELSKDQSWDEFAYHFDQVHGNYLQKLSENNIKLSPREIKLAAFLRMNMSSKEIAVMLNITLRGVELARYRLRKKLNLTREQNLVEYLISLDND